MLAGNIDRIVDAVDDGPATRWSMRQIRSLTRLPDSTRGRGWAALFATEPQWPRMYRSDCRSLRTRHSRVIRKIGPSTASFPAPPPASLPRLRSLVTRAASRWSRPSARRFACHAASHGRPRRAFGVVPPAHRGPQAPRHARSRPWRREFAARFAVAGRACGLCGQLEMTTSEWSRQC